MSDVRRDPTQHNRSWRDHGWAAAVAVIVAIGLLMLTTGRLATDPPEYTPVGEAAPLPGPGEFPSANRAAFDGILLGQAGTPVVVNIWASWCAPCRAEMPLLQRAAEDYEGRVTILGVASDDDPDAAARFLDEVGVTYPNIFDADSDIKRGLGLVAFPTTYVFDADGELVSAITGGISEQRLVGAISDALE